MNLLRKTLALSWNDRILIIHAWIALTALRGALWLIPVGRLRKGATFLWRPTAATPPDRPTPEHVGWAVTAASRFVPSGQNCLLRALTAEALLRRLGYESELHFGARKDGDGRLEAHAWLTSGDRIVVGGAEREAYTAMSRQRGSASA